MTSSLIASAMLRDPLYHIECLTAPSYTKYLISSARRDAPRQVHDARREDRLRPRPQRDGDEPLPGLDQRARAHPHAPPGSRRRRHPPHACQGQLREGAEVTTQTPLFDAVPVPARVHAWLAV